MLVGIEYSRMPLQYRLKLSKNIQKKAIFENYDYYHSL